MRLVHAPHNYVSVRCFGGVVGNSEVLAGAVEHAYWDDSKGKWIGNSTNNGREPPLEVFSSSQTTGKYLHEPTRTACIWIAAKIKRGLFDRYWYAGILNVLHPAHGIK